MKKKLSLLTIDEKYRTVINEVKKVIHSVVDHPFEVTLYGSVARGEETRESDLDLLVLIEAPVDFVLKEIIINAVYPIELHRDVVISLFIESKLVWETKYATLSMLYQNIQREGIHA
jgi:uncharacterized protein